MQRSQFLSSLLAIPFLSVLALARLTVPPASSSRNFRISCEPKDWLRLPRIPAWEGQGDAAYVLRVIQEGTKLRFHYAGGSTPGRLRCVTPDLLFRISPQGPLYFSAFCYERGAMRFSVWTGSKTGIPIRSEGRLFSCKTIPGM